MVSPADKKHAKLNINNGTAFSGLFENTGSKTSTEATMPVKPAATAK